MRKIGNVILDDTCYQGRDLYTDGAIEDEMLEIARNVSPDRFNKVIGEKKSWPILYHFSHIRENILSWMPFTGKEKVLEIGEIIGNHQADEELKEKIRRKKQAILDEYFDPATGDFAENQQGSNVFAVDLGIGDERTFANILKHYREIRKYDTGIFATDVLTRILFERGESELAISLLTSKEEDTFYSRMKKGGTTIPEYWTGHRSQCHPMFGAVSQYLFEYVLGIRQKESSVCYEDIVIAPECMDTIEAAEGSIMTKNGRISVKYDKTRLEVQVPEKTKALVRLNGKEKAKGDGEKWLRIEH